uniref:Protein kinase domain-containing protein n=1 Tax=Leersia perrieri TaxID=77586 RepID=A0A0D9V2S5_9ORYZ
MATAAAASSSQSCSAIFHRLLPHEMMTRTRLPETPSSSSSSDAVGELRLSDFDKIGDLGEGASGSVTKVRLRGTGAVFALKTAYYCGSGAEGEGEEKVEIAALRRLGGAPSPSPHVVRCHAVFRCDGGEPAILLELMDAGSLGDILRRRRRGLPEPAVAEVAARCLAALAHVHARGVAHLDLKPDNLLATTARGGDVKLADFSVSRVFLGDSGERRRVPIAAGSTAHMSPERFAPNAHAGPRGACAADVWGLGVTVMELFLGRCSFLPPAAAGEMVSSWVRLMEAICHGEPPSLPESSAASPELRGFVASCLHKDPRRRATVAQLMDHPFVARRDGEACRRQLWEIIGENIVEERST